MRFRTINHSPLPKSPPPVMLRGCISDWSWPSAIVSAMAILLLWRGGDHAIGGALAALLSLIGASFRMVQHRLHGHVGFRFTVWAASGMFALAMVLLGLAAFSQVAPYSTGYFAAWIYTLSLGAACLMGASIGVDRALARRVFKSLAVLGFMYAAVSLILWHSGGANNGVLLDQGLSTRFSATIQNPNAAACALGMFAVFVAAWMLNILSCRKFSGSDALFVVWLAIATTTLTAACVLTGSRASTVIVVIGLTCLTAAVVARRRVNSPKIRLAVGITASISIAAGAFGYLSLTRRGNLSDAVAGRVDGFDIFLRLSLQEPWLGYGPGTFRLINERSLTPETVDSIWNWGAAHNAVLQAALEGGWPYAILVTATLFYIAAVALRGALESREAFGLGGVIAFSVAIICGSVDIAMNVPAIATLALFSLGLAWGRAYAAGEQLTPKRLTRHNAMHLVSPHSAVP